MAELVILRETRCGSHIHTLSNVSTSTFLGLLQGRGSVFSSTAKFSGGRALRDGFLRSKPTSDWNLRFRGAAFSLFFCRARAEFWQTTPWSFGCDRASLERRRRLFHQPEGWRTSAGRWWCSDLQRAWPAKTQQGQRVTWPLITDEPMQESVGGGQESHHGLVFLNVLFSFLKALG